MKQRKATEEEVEALMRYLERQEDSGESPPRAWRAIVFGYSTLVDNCCDPKKTYLDWKPGIIVPPEQTTKGEV